MNDQLIADDLASLPANSPKWFSDALASPRREGYALVDNCRIHYFEWGDASKPGIILAHGMMAHARCWAFIAPLLADRFHLVAWDLSGMGDSGVRPGGYTLEQRAAEAIGVGEVSGMYSDGRKPALVCHSFGGTVGMLAAELYAERFAALIVCDMSMMKPGASPRHFQERIKNRKPPRPHKIYPVAADLLARFRLAPDQPCANDYLVDYLAQHSVRKVKGGWAWKFDPQIFLMEHHGDNAWWESIADRFAALPLPRGIIYGELSELFDGGMAEWVQSRTNDSIPVRGIPGAYHHLMLDEPAAFTAAIAEMLEALLLMPQGKT